MLANVEGHQKETQTEKSGFDVKLRQGISEVSECLLFLAHILSLASHNLLSFQGKSY